MARYYLLCPVLYYYIVKSKIELFCKYMFRMKGCCLVLIYLSLSTKGHMLMLRDWSITLVWERLGKKTGDIMLKINSSSSGALATRT
jgi:hypothetical protein